LFKFGLSDKKIYFLELSWSNFLVALLFRLAGVQVYYLTLSILWQKESKIQKLNELGINWLNYQDFNINKLDAYLAKVNNIKKHLQLFLTKNSVFHHLKKQAKIPDCEEFSLTTGLVMSMESKILLLAEIFVYAELIESKSNNNRWMWAPNDIISREILEKEGRWVNICPKILSSLGFGGNVLSRIFRIIFSQMITANFFTASKLTSVREKQNTSVSISQEAKWVKHEIIYFPHQGIWYGKQYLKDYFYSSDRKNPFYPSKILHISLSEPPKLIKSSLEYYNENDIPYADWNEIPSVTTKNMIIMSFFFIKKCLTRAGKEFDLYLLFIFLSNYIKIIHNIKRLEQFQNLKIVLVGYDMLFPVQLALACRIIKIKTTAVLERMIPLWFANPFMLDHYFVYGHASKEILDERFKSLIKNKYEIGPIRLGRHYECVKKSHEYIKQLPDYKFRVLALDHHSVTEFYQNGRSFGNNWKNNIKFYQDILNLCNSFPQVHFIIKGKDHNFIKIPYFSDIVNKIEETPNCMLVKDYEKWTPFTSVAISDIAIALHTSLGDEILALGKPVIFYDYFGFPGKILNLGSKLQAFTYEDLKLKLTSFLDNPDKYNKSLDPIRKKYYSISNTTPKLMLDKKLSEIYNK
jgi:hypothetical protein